MNILDYVLIGLAVVAVIIGIVRGLGKQITGLFGSFGALAAALILPPILWNLVKSTPLVEQFIGTASGWFVEPWMTTSFTSAEELKAILASNAGLLSSLSDMMFGLASGIGATTLAPVLGYYVSTAIFFVATCLVIYLIVYFVFRGITKLIAIITKNTFMKIVDKFLGIIWSVGILYIVVSVLFMGVGLIPDNILPEVVSPTLTYISQSKFGNILYNANFIGQEVSKLLGMAIRALPAV
ncbi:MAG: CvpA family protein [Clostridia bacterium]